MLRLLILTVTVWALPGCVGENHDDASGALPIPIPEPIPAPGWVVQESGGNVPINAVSAVDSSHAWTGDETVTSPQVIEGGLRRTLDGGSTWNFICETPEDQQHVVLYAPSVLDIQFFDAQAGYALTRWSLLATTNGGATWETRHNSLVNTHTSMSFSDPMTGWTLSDNSTGVQKTVDGGATWSFTVVDPSAVGRAIRFVDSQNGWAVFRSGTAGETIFKTTDAGATWQPSHFLAGDSFSIHDIATAGPDRAWIVGAMDDGSGGDIIWATQDGGATWEEQFSDDSGGLRGVHFVDAFNGWVVGQKIHHTTDGGATWEVQPTAEQGFRDVIFVNATTGWVVGENGVILKTTTGGEE
jgi:photosystem II stability/assembly factor-like uncharacterized protein